MDSHSWSLNCLPATPDLCWATAWGQGTQAGPRVQLMREKSKVNSGPQKPWSHRLQASLLPATPGDQLKAGRGQPPALSTQRQKDSKPGPHHSISQGHGPGGHRAAPPLASRRYDFCISRASLCATCPQPPLQLPPLASHSRLALNSTEQPCPSETLHPTHMPHEWLPSFLFSYQAFLNIKGMRAHCRKPAKCIIKRIEKLTSHPFPINPEEAADNNVAHLQTFFPCVAFVFITELLSEFLYCPPPRPPPHTNLIEHIRGVFTKNWK